MFTRALPSSRLEPQWRRVCSSPVSDKYDCPTNTKATLTQDPLKDMDDEIIALFGQWLTAFERTQSAADDEVTAAALAQIESRIATTLAEGLHGLAVKLGLHQFLGDSADADSDLAASAYSDLVRLTGLDPATEILAKLAHDRH